MARGVAKTIEEKLQPIDKKIGDLQQKISDLQAERKKIIEADRVAKLQKIMDIADEKGLSVDEVIAKISN